MRLYTLNDAPPLGPGLTVRESISGAILGAVVVFGGAGALVWALLAGHIPPFFWLGAIFLLLFAALSLRSLTAAFSIDNWRLHMAENGLFIKYRTALNRHLPRDVPVIAFIPWQEIESAHEVRRDATLHHANRAQRRTHRYLAFVLKYDAHDLAEAIANERTLPPPQGCMGGGRFLHDIAIMNGPREVRIEFSSNQTRARPSIRKTLGALEGRVPITDETREETEGPLFERPPRRSPDQE